MVFKLFFFLLNLKLYSIIFTFISTILLRQQTPNNVIQNGYTLSSYALRCWWRYWTLFISPLNMSCHKYFAVEFSLSHFITFSKLHNLLLTFLHLYLLPTPKHVWFVVADLRQYGPWYALWRPFFFNSFLFDFIQHFLQH